MSVPAEAGTAYPDPTGSDEAGTAYPDPTGGEEAGTAYPDPTGGEAGTAYPDPTGGEEAGTAYPDVTSGEEAGAAYPDSTGATGTEFGYPAPTPAPVSKIPTWLPTPSAGTSLFCWALMVATSYERGLLAGQYKSHASIFACNEFEVYSNMSVDLVPGLKCKAVTVNLQCKYGGEFKTALNTPIFITVWSQVVQDARYLEHDWTAKVDADAVFLPQRLRMLVTGVNEEPTGVYLTNCKLGMHGPLEVISRNAVTTWYHGITRCEQHFKTLCHGDCQWGEDMFIDQCLWKVLKIKRLKAFGMLVEDHCEAPQGWQSCLNSSAVAFHPFKQAAEYGACLKRAKTIGYTRPTFAPQEARPLHEYQAGLVRPVHTIRAVSPTPGMPNPSHPKASSTVTPTAVTLSPMAGSLASAGSATSATSAASAASAASSGKASDVCIGKGRDPHEGGKEGKCCPGLMKKLNNWDKGDRWFYLCVGTSDPDPEHKSPHGGD
jgi:hypothetical protein